MDGILNINKPLGRTSFSLVAMVKKLTGERHVGHAGTLDPAASGVLPICLGQGTQIVEFLMNTTKVYQAEIELGTVTDTYDGSGRVKQRGDPSGISQHQLESALASFCGVIRQTPPMYSAVKYHGKPLYKLARAGITVERKSRLVRIHRLELIDWRPPVATVKVTCGKGTYLRSLAYDLGQVLGCGAYLKGLVRLNYGPFDVKDAISTFQFEEACRYGYWPYFLYPVDSVLLSSAAMVVGKEVGQSLQTGRPLTLGKGGATPADHCRVYILDGSFLGMLRFNAEKGQWEREKVFLSLNGL